MNDTSMPVPGIQPPSLSVSDVQRGIGEASAVFHAGAEHLNMKGMLHGGIIAGLMDVIMAIAAGSHPEPAQRQFSITLSMSMNFIGSAAAEPLYLKAKTTGGRRRSNRHRPRCLQVNASRFRVSGKRPTNGLKII
mgnify:CR=1 FL=1